MDKKCCSDDVCSCEWTDECIMAQGVSKVVCIIVQIVEIKTYFNGVFFWKFFVC